MQHASESASHAFDVQSATAHLEQRIQREFASFHATEQHLRSQCAQLENDVAIQRQATVRQDHIAAQLHATEARLAAREQTHS